MTWSRLPPLAALRNQLRALLELPADVAELGVKLRDVRVATEAALALAKQPRPRWAQVMVLWTMPPPPRRVFRAGELPKDEPDPEREPRPGILTMSFDLHAEETRRSGVRSDTITHPIPAGAWLVACGCVVAQVFVGQELQDVGSGIAGLPLRVLRLRDPIEVGMYLRCNVVRPEEG